MLFILWFRVYLLFICLVTCTFEHLRYVLHILWFIESGGSMPHSQGLSKNPNPEPISPIDTCSFKIHPNIVLSSTPRPS